MFKGFFNKIKDQAMTNAVTKKIREYATMAIQIVLTPTVSHCIETVAKREYWKM